MKVKGLVHMTVSSFQEHLKSVALSTVMDVGFASQPVGYPSASQFSREMQRLVRECAEGHGQTSMTALAGWENSCVIVGSSAGALIGLQFVVITLIADMPMRGGQEQAGEAFATPTIVHFGAALLLSAILNAPWQRVGSAARFLGDC